MSDPVLVSEKNKILNVILNRPDVHNAFNPEMIKILTDLFLRISDDDNIRAIMLSGKGSSFCAGADLSWMKSMKDFSFEENLKDSENLYDMFLSMRNCLKPIVSKIHGNVFGGGLGLIAICDVAASVEGTIFSFSEARLGLVPAVISPFVLDKMSPSCFREFSLTAQKFSSKQAKDSGLIQFSGDEKSVDDYLLQTLENIKLCGSEAICETKKLILKFSNSHFWSYSRKETTEVISQRRVSDEGQKRLKSFFSKTNFY